MTAMPTGLAAYDRFLPDPDIRQRDSVLLGVSAEQGLALARRFDARTVPLARFLFQLRQLGEAPADELSLAGIVSGGASVALLHDDAHGFVAGAVARFWQRRVESRDVPTEEFQGFAEPGWGKLVWGVDVARLTEGTCRLSFELRLTATDPEALAQLRRHWSLVGPFSRWIRRAALHRIEDQAGGPAEREQSMPMPGDDLLPEARMTLTHGVTIEAAPADVWPWLLQMGCDRGGWYSWDLLDNNGRTSARELDPRWADLAVGDELPSTPGSEHGFVVMELEPHEHLVLASDSRWGDVEHEGLWQTTWAFELRPQGDSTRLSVRARVHWKPDALGVPARLLGPPVHGFMERRQLQNLKRRVEGDLPGPASGWREVLEGGVGAAGILLALATPFMRSYRGRWGLPVNANEWDLPGDSFIDLPDWAWTHGVHVDASPEAVWPWVAQIGAARGGFYSYQWLENLVGCRVENADVVREDWAVKRVGDTLSLHPDLPPLPVVELEPGAHFVVAAFRDLETNEAFDPAQGWPRRYLAVSWLFLVKPHEGGARVISRYRCASSEDRATRLTYGAGLAEPVGFVMDRRMLLGIKERAEAAP